MGVDAQENPGGPLRPGPTFAFCQVPFLMNFATGKIPHAVSQDATTLEKPEDSPLNMR